MKKILLLGALSGLCWLAVADTAKTPALDQMRPYIQVKTVDGDEFTVRTFFSPNCAFSRQYFPFFRNLSRTIPATQKFEFTPLVNKGDGIEYALAFMAVRRFYPQYVQNFVEASLQGVQDMGMSPRNWAAIDRIGKAAHIPVSLPKLVGDNFSTLQADVNKIVQLQHDLKITNTPSVAVAGTYIVTPEFTAGNSEQFSNLVNGLVSMVNPSR